MPILPRSAQPVNALLAQTGAGDRADVPQRLIGPRRTASSTTATAVTYAACSRTLVASTSAGHRQGGGVRPSSGKSVSVLRD